MTRCNIRIKTIAIRTDSGAKPDKILKKRRKVPVRVQANQDIQPEGKKRAILKQIRKLIPEWRSEG